MNFVVRQENGEQIQYPDNIPLGITPIQKYFFLGGKDFYIMGNKLVTNNWTDLGIPLNRLSNDTPLVAAMSGNTLQVATENWLLSFSGITSKKVDMVTFNPWTKDVYWKWSENNGFAIFRNNEKITAVYPDILRYSLSTDNEHLMFVGVDANQKRFILKDGQIMNTIRENYIPGTLRMNGIHNIYAIKNPEDGSTSLVYDGSSQERKLDEVREIFLDGGSSGFSYFWRPQWEESYCFFSRYNGNLCGLDGYMNPSLEADKSGVIFAWLRDGNWSIYRNTSTFIDSTGYTNTRDVSLDYFYFDQTNPRYFLFIEHTENGYTLDKQGKKLPNIWKDFDPESISFGYDGKIFLSVQDQEGWRVLEI